MQFYAARKSAAKDAHNLSAQLAHLRSSFRTVCACDTRYVSTIPLHDWLGRRTAFVLAATFGLPSSRLRSAGSGCACTARIWLIEALQVRVVAHSLGCMHVLAATSQLSPDERPDLIYLCAPAVCEGECRDILACVRQITCVQ